MCGVWYISLNLYIDVDWLVGVNRGAEVCDDMNVQHACRTFKVFIISLK